jgi:hypothetical protein
MAAEPFEVSITEAGIADLRGAGGGGAGGAGASSAAGRTSAARR